MARDLLREVDKTADNGQSQDRLDLDDQYVAQAVEPAGVDSRQVREVKRDRALAHIAVMLLDVARAIQPVVAVFSGRLFLLIALLSSVWLTHLAMREPTVERIAGVAGFMILATFLLRFGIK